MTDGFEDNADFVEKSNGFVGDSGGERAPGNGWEYEPTYIHSYIKVPWHYRMRCVFERMVDLFKRR